MEKCHPAAAALSDIFSKYRSTGYVSLLILILLTTFSGLGMEGYLKANAENRMVRRIAQSTQALYAAEGGIEWAKAHLTVNPDLRRGSLSLDTGEVEIEIEAIVFETIVVETGVIETIGGGYKVTSESRSGLAVRKIEAILQSVAGKWVLKNYQELHS